MPQPNNHRAHLASRPGGDAFEQQARRWLRAVSRRARRAVEPLIVQRTYAMQRQTPGGETAKKPPDAKKDAGEVVTEGLKTVAEQAKDNNPQVKKLIIDPIKRSAQGTNGTALDTGEKAATIGFGAATVGPGEAARCSLRPGAPANSWKVSIWLRRSR